MPLEIGALPHSMQPPSDPFDVLLERWGKVIPPPPAQLDTEVWRRIAAMDAPETRVNFFARVEAVFARPAFTVMFIVACMLFGLFLAEVRISRSQATRSFQVVQNYLRLIDPLLEAGADYSDELRRPLP